MPGKYIKLIWRATNPNQPFFPRSQGLNPGFSKDHNFGVWQFCGKISEVSLIT